MKRRSFHINLTKALTAYLLLDAADATNAFARKIRPNIDHWANRLNIICSDLKSNTISPAQWQDEIYDLFSSIPLEDILGFIDFERLTRGFEFPDLGVNTRMVKYPEIEGLEEVVYVKKIFGLKKDRAIIPHGHGNMASSHLILQGDFHLRQYDRVHSDDSSLLVRPTVDKKITSGAHSSISDERNNVHWFIAGSDHSFTFDVIVLDLNGRKYEIDNLDMEAATDAGDGLIRVPVMDVDTALKKYGKHHH